jgi:drug/metabolite transporter (DMT)-like permease
MRARRYFKGGSALVGPSLLAILVMILWSACYPLITIGIAYSPHLSFAALRAGLAGTVLLMVAIYLREPIPKGWAIWGWICLAGLGMTGLGYFGMFHAAEFVAPGLATVIANTQPIIAGILAYVLLGERLAARGRLGMLIGLVGAVIIAAPKFLAEDARATGFGVLYVLLAVLGVAGGNVAIKKLATRVDPAMAMGLQLLVGAVPLAAIALTTENPREIEWAAPFVVSLLFLALPGTALAFWLWQSALRAIPLSRANVFSFLVPIFGITIGTLFFAEPLTWPVAIGVGVAAFGVYVATRS